MDGNNSIEVINLKKKFTVRYTTIYGGLAKSGVTQVLDGLSFNLKKGEVLGLIGKNGCGKSTLLKILTRIMDPDEGKFEIRGRVASILELGMGFDPESSGRDNIRIKCGLYGLTNKEIEGCIEDIIAFSEIGEQIDHPLRTYSSGMTAKLAFSILIYVKCDVLIIDEVLSVGDAGFNSKCRMAFERMKKEGRSILIASHNVSLLESMCDRVMWVDMGKVREIGDPLVICYRYESDTVDSIESVLSLADSGDVIAINRAGVMYRDGINVQTNIAKAIELFEKASNMGYTESQINLANMMIVDNKIDYAKELLVKASSTGNSEAIATLMYLDDGDNNRIVEIIKELTEKGNTRAMKILADMYYNGIIVPKSIKEAIKLYEKCAEYGNGQAMHTLGLCYRDGIGIEKDAIKAINYFEKAATLGNNRSRIELANTYRKGIGVDRDMDVAIKWYQEAAKTGDSKSMLELATIYRDGLGVDVDPVKSKIWMKRFSDLGLGNIEWIIGDIFYQGFIGERQKESIEWYREASKRGNISSMITLSKIYREGILIKPDYNLAKEYLRMAAECCNGNAMYDFGLLCMSGDDVKDNRDALFYVKKSAMMGNRKSMLLFTNLFRADCYCKEDEKDYEIIMKILDETADVGSRLYNSIGK